LLLPSFSPKTVNILDGELRKYCRDLIAELGDRGTADAAEEYAQHIPIHDICVLTGLPEGDARELAQLSQLR
jgi:cytochrome P450